MSVASRREQPQAATYSKRLKDNIRSILDNYGEILKASKVSTPTCLSGNLQNTRNYHVE